MHLFVYLAEPLHLRSSVHRYDHPTELHYHIAQLIGHSLLRQRVVHELRRGSVLCETRHVAVNTVLPAQLCHLQLSWEHVAQQCRPMLGDAGQLQGLFCKTT